MTPGFTLVELMLASVLSAIVFAAIFAAYIFIARNLARIANIQQQQVQDRRAFYVVSKDVNDAVQITSAQQYSMTLRLSSGDIIVYSCTIPVIGPPLIPGTLTRQVNGASPAPVVLSNLVIFTFNYFNKSGTSGATAQNTKQIEMSYTSAVGVSANGTQARNIVVSQRMLLRGKPYLGQ